MKKIYSIRTFLILVGLIGLYILCRSIYFSENLNFSADQGEQVAKTYELWRDKKIELIGPAISFRTNGRMIFFGSISYYFSWFFLLPGNFDHLVSSYLFMLFGALMLVPLYFGVKNLGNEKKAIFVCSVYSFLPLYIDYSRFLWNPNYQFVLTPLVVLLVSIYMKNKNNWWLFLESSLMGILLMFHYQYFVVIAIFFAFHLINKKFGLKEVVIFIGGITFGFFPLIFFELRHNFYNLRTLFMLTNSKDGIFGQGGGINEKHYFLSISLCLLIFITSIKKIKLNWTVVTVFGIVLFAISMMKAINEPLNGFGMAKNWNYPLELKVNNIIRTEEKNNYNVTNLIYNTKASVQKYLFMINGEKIDENNYATNKYLYIITDQDTPLNDPAYEVSRFKPSTLAKKWEINDQYQLFLYQRD